MDVLPHILEQKEMMTREETRLLRLKKNKNIRIHLFLFTVIFIPLIHYQDFTKSLYIMVLLWAIPAAIIILGGLGGIDNGIKLVTRGKITARFERKDGDDGFSYVFQVNDKLFTVSRSVYRKYHKRDLVEFHFTSDGYLLKHILLSRGDKTNR